MAKSQFDSRIEDLDINNLHIEQVQQYKYLGSIINDSNSIEVEIKERIALGIKAYYYYYYYYHHHHHHHLWLCSPARAMASSFTRFLDHAHRRARFGRNPLDE
jgi:hypothetical protein